MARDDPQMKLRLPAGLKARVEEAAQHAGRSLNAEIVHRLEQSLSSADHVFEPFVNKLIAATEKAVADRYRDEGGEKRFAAETPRSSGAGSVAEPEPQPKRSLGRG